MRPHVARLTAILLYSCCIGATLHAQVVGRRSNDRAADLISALVQASRFDDALKLCQAELRGADAESDASAKWNIRRSQILTARFMSRQKFEDAEVVAAQQPVNELLQAYPRHRRVLFLQSQLALVKRDAARHSVLRAVVAPTNDGAREDALKRLLRSAEELSTLSDRVGDARSRLDSTRGARDFAMAADLIRLQQELQVDVVSLALMQTELFADGSSDRVAAATKAEQAAEEAMARLPADTTARQEVERLRIEAIVRADQFARAQSLLEPMVRAWGPSISPSVIALQTRIDVAQGRNRQAESRLGQYYGDAPITAPQSIDMDLARLEFLLRSDRSAEVGAWLDAIEKRGGAYARRRAEAVSLAYLRNGTTQQGVMVDPSLVAAQGQDWLRRGDPSRAGDLLSAAATAERNDDRAIERASEAAAALTSADRNSDAADILAEISLAHPKAAKAAATHLQAMFIVASLKEPNASVRLERMLRANLQQWPAGPSASACRRWLGKILTAQNRLVEAAEVACLIAVTDINAQELVSVVDHWREAFRSADDDAVADASRRLQQAFRPLLDDESAVGAYRLCAALLIDRAALAGLPDPPRDPVDLTGREFGEWLLEFRRARGEPKRSQMPPRDFAGDATLRLMRDGRADPKLRDRIVRLLDQWDQDTDASMSRAERLLWKGQSSEAVRMFRQLIDNATDAKKMMQQASTVLSSDGKRSSLEAAVELWDQFAAGSKQGSQSWHQAKLAAMELLKRSGDSGMAKQRARYILLTMPTMSDDLKRRYQAYSR